MSSKSTGSASSSSSEQQDRTDKAEMQVSGPIRVLRVGSGGFGFVKGPYVVPLEDRFSHDSDDEDLLTWRQPGIPRGQDKMDVSSIIEGITPDTKGVFAFSLGCAAVLVAMAEHPEAFANVKFLICASGNLPQNPTLVEEIEKSPLVKTIPVMLIYGKKDQVVPEERFNTFKGVFPDPLIFYHDGGHVVPGSSRQQVREFMEKYI